MQALRPEHYLEAARERIVQAGELYRGQDSFALAMYAAGLAVECLLRAFKSKRDPIFDERHDLKRLYHASGIKDLVRDSSPADFNATVVEIASLWSNALRFYSEERVRAFMKKDVALRKGIKGDILKENARRLIEASRWFVSKGLALWTS
jgi:hypothetical protein